jgi:hypothetical protein
LSVVSEIEIWRSAKLMIAQSAEESVAHAVERAIECDASADIDGWIRWMRIAEAILEIQSPKPQGAFPNSG